MLANSPLHPAVLFVRVVTGICKQNGESICANSVTAVSSHRVNVCFFFLTRLQCTSVKKPSEKQEISEHYTICR